MLFKKAADMGHPVAAYNLSRFFYYGTGVQQNYIQTHLLTFKEFMRKQLNNFYLDIVLVQAAPDEEEVKFLTGKDKFAALARKNPNLHTLKNRFNLDIDY